MGSNTLLIGADGTPIPASIVNQFSTALKDDLLPRDTSTLAPTDIAGDLGGSSYRWNNAYTKKLYIGTAANLNTIEEVAGDIVITNPEPGKSIIYDADTQHEFKINGVSKAIVDTGGLTKGSLPVLGQQVSSSSGNYAGTNTTWAAVTNLSVTITTIGRPVYLALIGPDGADTPNESKYGIGKAASGGGGTAHTRFVRGTTSLGIWLLSLTDTANVANLNMGFSSGPSHIDVVSAGTYTYTFETKNTGSNVLMSCKYLRLIAFEL